MKPRIRQRRGIWDCRAPAWRVVGYGYTPAQAYAEWWACLRQFWLSNPYA